MDSEYYDWITQQERERERYERDHGEEHWDYEPVDDDGYDEPWPWEC